MSKSESSTTDNASAAGYVRVRKASKAVLLADKAADKIITIGGFFIIVAVMGVMVFLINIVVPLFSGGKITGERTYQLPLQNAERPLLWLDEFKSAGASLDLAGNLVFFDLGTGQIIDKRPIDLFGKKPTTLSRTIQKDDVAFGFEDGAVSFGKVRLVNQVIGAADAPKELKEIGKGRFVHEGVLYTALPNDQYRRIELETKFDDPAEASESGAPITFIDYHVAGTAEKPIRSFAALDAQGGVSIALVEMKMNMLTRKMSSDVSKTRLTLPEGVKPAHLLMTSKADQVYVAEKSGRVHRFNTQNFSSPELAESVDVTPKGVELTVFTFLIGETTLISGGSDGSLKKWFRLRRENVGATDGFTLVNAGTFDKLGAPIREFDPSARGKAFLAVDQSGKGRIFYSTNVATLLDFSVKAGEAAALVFTPRNDGVFSLNRSGQATLFDLDMPHPESGVKALFGKVWYEGYPEPTFTWQSTGMDDAFEPKMSIVPLMFGTIKAAFYSLLFAVPIALLAAVYTSEFLHLKYRTKIKPAMEMMASLPSVILGFVGALVLAPVIENWIASTLLIFGILPLSLVVGAQLWQLLPPVTARKWEHPHKLVFIVGFVFLSLYLSYLAGPVVEDLFFGGDFKIFLTSREGSERPLLTLLLLPLAYFATGAVIERFMGKRITATMRLRGPVFSGRLDMLRFGAESFAAVCLAFIFAAILETVGLGVRGGFMDVYVQRNTLIVAFAMGFAVIPLIYTLAEDALSSVPEHLRSASLACGASPWQTAKFIILPTAASGIFSAVMIGMGRAVGETMIVVMAAGNTPILDWNLFNGLRALSANIAVELPEAPKDGTLYRILYLTGLVLFAMTFIINTASELIRIRFRKKAAKL